MVIPMLEDQRQAVAEADAVKGILSSPYHVPDRDVP